MPDPAKIPLTNFELVEKYAGGATSGKTGGGTLEIKGNTIYSYNFPVAHRTSRKTAVVSSKKQFRRRGIGDHHKVVELALRAAGYKIKFVEPDKVPKGEEPEVDVPVKFKRPIPGFPKKGELFPGYEVIEKVAQFAKKNMVGVESITIDLIENKIRITRLVTNEIEIDNET